MEGKLDSNRGRQVRFQKKKTLIKETANVVAKTVKQIIQLNMRTRDKRYEPNNDLMLNGDNKHAKYKQG